MSNITEINTQIKELEQELKSLDDELIALFASEPGKLGNKPLAIRVGEILEQSAKTYDAHKSATRNKTAMKKVEEAAEVYIEGGHALKTVIDLRRRLQLQLRRLVDLEVDVYEHTNQSREAFSNASVNIRAQGGGAANDVAGLLDQAEESFLETVGGYENLHETRNYQRAYLNGSPYVL